MSFRKDDDGWMEYSTAVQDENNAESPKKLLINWFLMKKMLALTLQINLKLTLQVMPTLTPHEHDLDPDDADAIGKCNVLEKTSSYP